MKKLLVVLFVFFSFFLLQVNSVIPADLKTGYTSAKILEWIEYIQIGDQWYQVTHLDDGGIVVTPISTPIRD